MTVTLGAPFQCFLCKKWFAEEAGMESPECCVGGHWTPHSSEDRPRGPVLLHCCHQHQTEVSEPTNPNTTFGSLAPTGRRY